MVNEDNRPGHDASSAISAQALRLRAEEIAGADAAQSPDGPEALSPDETRRMLGELRVHQIELEMQNEELRRTQAELGVSRARYFDLYDLAPVGYVTLSERGLIREANLTLATLLGVTRRELVKQSLTRFILPADQDIFYRCRQLLFDTGAPQVCELRMTRTHAAPFWAHIVAALAQDGPDDAVVCRATLSDITERKQAEEAQRLLDQRLQQAQKLESLGVLAGGIAHDFNNILTAVLGHAELALDEISLLSPARCSLMEINTAARRAAELCRQMLAYSGKASFALEHVDLRELIEEIGHLIEASVSKTTRLNLRLDDDLPPILADASQIRQVVMNLIINASEALGERGGVVAVTTHVTHYAPGDPRVAEWQDDVPAGRYVELEVIDTGGGMDAETRSRIFEPFFTTKFVGRGLGLAAVLGIVRSHRGVVMVDSEPGRGTTFRVLFPALEDADNGAPARDAAFASEWHGSGTILLVDDEETLRTVGSRMLERLGFAVLTASDGGEAVERYRERQGEIDAVILDLTMPRMDGAEALGELLLVNPDVRVVLASGYAREDVMERFAGRGFTAFIQKPYTLDQLRYVLSGLVPSSGS
jgi:PAS domain S-box-containing protein